MKIITRIYRHFAHDSLYRNSIYLMLSTAVMGILGFFFWIICSKLYSAEKIGIATSIISAASLVSVLSLLGFSNVNIRFLPTSKDKNKLISVGFLLTTIASFIFSVISFIWIIHTRVGGYLGKSVSLIFLLFFSYVLFLTIGNLLDSIFIASRSAKIVLVKNTIMSLIKLIFPVFLISFSIWGIIGSIVISVFASILFGFVILIRKFKYKPRIVLDKEIIKQTGRFTFGNYIGNIFGILPSTLIPIMVVSELGSSKGAFFYMPLMIVGFLNIVPSATAQSFFAEASHDENNFGRFLWHAIKNIYLILIPLVVFVIIFANIILRFFGANYAAEGSTVLRILALASLVGAGNYIADTLLNIKKRVGLYAFMNIFNSLIIVFLVYFLAPKGLAWVGYAGLIGQALTLIVYFIINRNILSQIYKEI